MFLPRILSGILVLCAGLAGIAETVCAGDGSEVLLAQGGGRRRGPGGGGFGGPGGYGGNWRGRPDEMQPPAVQEKPAEEPKKDASAEGDKPKEEPKPTGPPPIARSQSPGYRPNPADFNVRPGKDGKLQFNFQGQPWLDVLEWLADISNLSLDWQEIPSDYLNLRTQRSYTIDEIRDLINRHLLDRGFTMLRNGEVLSVVNTKKVDPSLVPRVRPDDLAHREPHEFVKVSFRLDRMLAETAIEELKPMLSPNGKLTALKSTNRVEAIDAVSNLSQIYELLTEEESAPGQEKKLVREFRLEHTRAAEVNDMLRGLLGIDKTVGNGAAAMTPEQQMMAQQQAMMMAQQRGGQPNPMPGAGADKAKADIHLVVNVRENSIIVRAPPDQMAVIAETIKTVDIPSANANSLTQKINRMQIYRLATIDPEPLVKVLEEMGNLDPGSQLRIDKKNRSIIAYATLADHVTIRMMVTKLDGTDRKFEVIKLRKLEAAYVAGSIEFMMGAADKKTQQRNPFFDFYGSRNSEQETEKGKFRVDADVEYNRLLLWANEVELEEIRNLLVKLGEIPGANASTTRVVEDLSPDEADELLRKLRKEWPSYAPNPLNVPAPRPRKNPAEEPAAPSAQFKSPETEKTRTAPSLKDPDRDTTTFRTAGRIHLVQLSAEDLAPAAKSAPVKPVDDKPDHQPAADKTPPTAEPSEKPRLAKPAGSNAAAADSEPDAPPPFPPQRRPQIPPRRAYATDDEPNPTKPQVPPPVTINRSPDGKLIITSPDVQALDLMEDLVTKMTPPRRDFKVFKLKYKSTWAYSVALNLKEFFEDKDKKEESSSRRRSFWDPPAPTTPDNANRLSKKRPLKFISDSDTNTILVTGADPDQLRIIEDLITNVYDIPPGAADAKAIRKTQVFKIRYSKARIVADAIKDVYRDLLSDNDKALAEANNNRKDTRPSGPSYTYVFSDGEEDGASKKPETPVKFKGLLSIGVDELANNLIVSAPETLLENIAPAIEELDQAAKSTVTTVRVRRLNSKIDAGLLQEKLGKLVGAQQPQQGQPGRPNGQQPQQQMQQPGQGRGQRGQQQQNQQADDNN